MTFLFDSIIFGPVYSRRLGKSLGINLLPTHKKICNYNCIYCECGLTRESKGKSRELPSRQAVYDHLKHTLRDAKKRNKQIDSITFAGNGEPTLHPQFPEIVDDVVELRDKEYPEAKIAILSNATTITDNKIYKALHRADQNILKLDTAFNETIQTINCPRIKVKAEELINNLKNFNGNLIIQTLFLKGNYKGKYIDNTSPEEVNAWLNALQLIKPSQVMIYTFSRETPISGLEKIPKRILVDIGNRVKKLGLDIQISA
jgi:wyosine [tRNA(Phe)-imidazoG37] synthetase (radical SAM superfamily)